MNLWQFLAGVLGWEWAGYAFMQRALAAVALVSLLYGMAGSMVVNAQMAFFSDAVGHAALTGIAIGALLGLGDPLWAMAGFSVLLAIAITVVRRMAAASTDTVIGLFMALAVALGVAILSRGGGFARYSRYLIGDILSITPSELGRLAVLTVLAVAGLALLYNRMALISLNPGLARSRGLAVPVWEGLFAALVALIVTVSIQWVGLLVINSLLIIPAAAARNLAANSRQYLWLAVGISLASGLAGLIVSYHWGTASGATIVLMAMGFFAITLLFRKHKGGTAR
jgi:zinc transport system permease protein